MLASATAVAPTKDGETKKMRIITTLVLGILCSSCSVQESEKAYTGVFKIDAGTEYAAFDVPSTIGGACTGWNAIEIRKPGMPGTGMTNVVCWKRTGNMIAISSSIGSSQAPAPANLWSD